MTIITKANEEATQMTIDSLKITTQSAVIAVPEDEAVAPAMEEHFLIAWWRPEEQHMGDSF